MSMLQVCGQPGCSTLVPRGYCAEHARKPWEGSDRSRRRIRGSRGQHMRRNILRKYPFCQWPDCDELSTIADHIVPLEEGGSPTEENMHGLCGPHHDKKTREEKRHIGYWDKVLRGEIE